MSSSVQNSYVTMRRRHSIEDCPSRCRQMNWGWGEHDRTVLNDMTVRHWILLRENNGRDQNSKYAWPGWLFNEDKAFWIANYLVKRLKSLSAKDSHPMRGYQYRLLGTKLYRICYFCCFGCLEGHLRQSYSPVKSGLRNIRFLPKTSRMQIS